MKRVSIGLRARVLSLVLFAVIPAFGVIVYTAIDQRDTAVREAEKEATNLVRLLSREQNKMMSSTRQLLTNMSQLTVVRDPSSGEICNTILAEQQSSHPYYTNLGVIAPDGELFCNSRPLKRKINLADRSYFRRVLQTKKFSVGDYQVSRITGEPAINFAQPVMADGELRAVVYAGLSIGWIRQLVESIELPTNALVTVIDGNGSVLAAYPNGEQWIGKSARDTQLVQFIRESRQAGMIEAIGLDGESRLYAFVPLFDNTLGNIYISVGVSKTAMLQLADKTFIRSVTVLIATALLVLIVAWFGADAFVLRRVNALVKVSQRLAKGDLSARTGLVHGDEELGRLAGAMDDMAAALQRVNRALKTLSAGNRAVLRATEEQELLEEMCRVIGNVGGYRLACIAYADKEAPDVFRIVAQCGFESGTQALAHTLENAGAEASRVPLARAIQSGVTQVAHDLRLDPVLERFHYASCVAFPLKFNGEAIGALAIFSHEPDAFDAEELELLDEAAADLAFGIAGLRGHAERNAARATIERMAYQDSLTALPNHPYFEMQLGQTLANANALAQTVAVFVIGVNRLQEINDALGFHNGDRLLREIGQRIRTVVRAEALVARLRGDEFGVLLEPKRLDEPAEVAQQILNALAVPFGISDLRIDVGTAIGIALFPEHTVDARHLMRCADVAMHQAKRSGKNFGVYAAERDGDNARRLKLAGELSHAIEENQLLLYYQPKIDLRQNRVCGVEALVRWPHPLRGMIPPDDFIGLAEHTGLIKPLTQWVINEALRQSANWRREGLSLPIAVNLSARNLHDEELIYDLDQSFAAWRATPDWLELEITEGAMMQNPEGARQVLQRLKTMGVKIFIDDFGTGHSSLGYLKKLPVDSMKIDKSFVIDMLSNTDSAAIVRSTISLAHDLDVKVVAEGVESQEALKLLASLGCDVAQGYHISKPLPADQFEAWMDRYARAS